MMNNLRKTDTWLNITSGISVMEDETFNTYEIVIQTILVDVDRQIREIQDLIRDIKINH